MPPPIQQSVKQEAHDVDVKNSHDVPNKETGKSSTKAPKNGSHLQEKDVSRVRSLLIVSVIGVGETHQISKNHLASPHWRLAKNSFPNSPSSIVW